MTLEELQSKDWFEPLVNEVQKELERLRGRRDDVRPALLHEKGELEAQSRGWLITLGNASLDLSVRGQVEEMMRAATERIREIDAALGRETAGNEQFENAIDVREVASRIDRLAEVLANNDPTRGNLELSLHIDRIDCFPDGSAVVRTCRLGALAGARDLLQGDSSQMRDADGSADDAPRRESRAGGRRRVDDLHDASLLATAYWAQNPDRFAGLDEKWFVEDVIRPAPYQSWAQRHAKEVAEKRAEGLTHEALAAHFGVSTPTIRKAIRFASVGDESVKALPRKVRRSCWRDEHADEVFQLYSAGAKMEELAKQFGKAVETIRLAIVAAKRNQRQAQGNAA